MPHEPADGPAQPLRALVAIAAAPDWLHDLAKLRDHLLDQALHYLAQDLDDPAIWQHLTDFFGLCYSAGRLRSLMTVTTGTDALPMLHWATADQVLVGQPGDQWLLHVSLSRHLMDRLDSYLHDRLLALDALCGQEPTAQRANLTRAAAIRRAAGRLIGPLAWWEEVVLALWEAERPVTERAWVVTLDHVPGELYADIAKARAQTDEWHRLFPGLMPADRRITAVDLVAWVRLGLTLPVDTRLLSKNARLRLVADLEKDAEAAANLVIIGDNADGLRFLLGGDGRVIDTIYIDPPYNTGGDAFPYHDGYDHGTWLTMMRDRLALAARLLKDDGDLLISCDDHEQHRLRALLETLDLPAPFLGNLIWKSRQNVDSRNGSNLSNDHEFILACGRRFRGADKDLGKYANPDDDPRGPWMSDNLVGLATRERRPNLHYHLLVTSAEEAGSPQPLAIRHKGRVLPLPASLQVAGDGDRILACISWDASAVLAWARLPDDGASRRARSGWYPCPDKGWRYEPASWLRKACDGRILWPAQVTGRPRKKTYRDELRSAYTGFSTVVGYSADGTKELSALFGPGTAFTFPKPVSLLTTLLTQTLPADGTVLDYFAGSGTTAHAVVALNRTDAGQRRYVLIEVADHADAVLVPRIKKALVADQWRGGRPLHPSGMSHRLHLVRLASFADHLAQLPLVALSDHLTMAELPEPHAWARRLLAEAAGATDR
jgi:adenine-specific DNA-methyltransferase